MNKRNMSFMSAALLLLSANLALGQNAETFSCPAPTRIVAEAHTVLHFSNGDHVFSIQAEALCAMDPNTGRLHAHMDVNRFLDGKHMDGYSFLGNGDAFINIKAQDDGMERVRLTLDIVNPDMISNSTVNAVLDPEAEGASVCDPAVGCPSPPPEA